MSPVTCSDALDWLRSLPSESADLVLTDPPYGTTAAAWDIAPPWAELFAELWRVLKPAAPICMFCQMPLGAQLIVDNLREFRYEWIWEKSAAVGFLNANKCPLRAHENILVFARNQPKYRAVPIASQSGEPYERDSRPGSNVYGKQHLDIPPRSSLDGSRFPRDVISTQSIANAGRLHPTQKPVELLKILIDQYTEVGDTVIDPFAGSGSTLVAAKELARGALGSELDPDFFAIAARRLAETQPGLPVM